MYRYRVRSCFLRTKIILTYRTLFGPLSFGVQTVFLRLISEPPIAGEACCRVLLIDLLLHLLRSLPYHLFIAVSTNYFGLVRYRYVI
jgi:hypothetical protein